MNRLKNTKLFLWLKKKNQAITKDDIITAVQYTVLIIVCSYFTYTGEPALQSQSSNAGVSIANIVTTRQDFPAVLTASGESRFTNASFANLNSLENQQHSFYSDIIYNRQMKTSVYCYLHGTVSKVYYLEEYDVPQFSLGFLNIHTSIHFK